MAGINRLGKAAPRPGSLRPPDPNKNRVLDMYSEGDARDKDYMRMVQDIEDVQQSQVGWLFGRGAFDKTDLLYLRDQEERSRHSELELKDSERLRYAALRAKADQGLERPSLGIPRPPRRDKSDKRPAKVLAAVVKVRSSAEKQAAGSPAEGQSDPKRSRSGSNDAQPSINAAGDETAGLAGLLGDYGSDSEPEEDAASPSAAQAPDSAQAASHDREQQQPDGGATEACSLPGREDADPDIAQREQEEPDYGTDSSSGS